MEKEKKTRIIRIVLCVLAILVAAAIVLSIIQIARFYSLEETGLPRLDVTTNGGAKINSKETYVGCTVSLSGTDAAYCFSNATAGIRGRGNDTWTYYPKKPYRIRFDQKISLFGEEENRSWVLLALYNDFSLTKDRLAFGMAEALNADFAPCYHYVDLYVNDEYMGVYLLTDQVDENKGRADVEERFTAEDTEVPFLVELDSRAPDEGVEGVDWFKTSDGRSYAVKYPDATERYTQAQFDYIRDYVTTVDALCRKPGVTLAELGEYVDVQSLIDYYLVQETMGQPEMNWKSVYMSKSRDGLLVMGPVWDFDWAAEGPSLGDQAWQYRQKYDGLRSVDNWFAALYNGSPEFRAAVATRWQEVRGTLLSVIDTVEAEKPMLEKAAERNDLRWNWYRFNSDFDERFAETIDWCRNRIAWLDTEFSA